MSKVKLTHQLSPPIIYSTMINDISQSTLTYLARIQRQTDKDSVYESKPVHDFITNLVNKLSSKSYQQMNEQEFISLYCSTFDSVSNELQQLNITHQIPDDVYTHISASIHNLLNLAYSFKNLYEFDTNYPHGI